MPYASVVLDIPTRALDRAYDYRVPPQLADEAVVGATVLVTFSHRAAVGYVRLQASIPRRSSRSSRSSHRPPSTRSQPA